MLWLMIFLVVLHNLSSSFIASSCDFFPFQYAIATYVSEREQEEENNCDEIVEQRLEMLLLFIYENIETHVR